jgi:poly(3-hydroxybutyrate) depolymerase
MPPRSAWDGWVLSLAAAMRVSEAALKPWSEFLGIPPEEQPAPEEPTWVTPNTVRIELPAMRLREFANGEGTPTLVVAPFALHGATLADLAPGHSLVERLLGAGVGPLFLVECKSATEMRFFTIDTYLADLALAVEETGGRANLVGLCQGLAVADVCGTLPAENRAACTRRLADRPRRRPLADGHGHAHDRARDLPRARG